MSDPKEVGLKAFQERVAPWMQACFGPTISADKLERGDRLLEEAFELLQSGDYPVERVDALRDYVWGRPKGDPAQEVGGVMVTLAAYCLAHGLDMHQAGETELARIWTKVEKIRAKQAAKPTGSALPVAAPSPSPDLVEAVERLGNIAECGERDGRCFAFINGTYFRHPGRGPGGLAADIRQVLAAIRSSSQGVAADHVADAGKMVVRKGSAPVLSEEVREALKPFYAACVVLGDGRADDEQVFLSIRGRLTDRPQIQHRALKLGDFRRLRALLNPKGAADER